MSEVALQFETRGPVAWLTLNRPEAMNALNLEVVSLYEKYLPQIAADDNIKVLVITGKGSAFCAGADLKEVLATAALPPGEQDFLDRLCAVFDILRDLPKPVIVAINGTTLAGGLETSLCADIIIAAEGAQIGDAHANYGVYPGGGGAALLPRVIPQNVAKYLLLTGKTLSAEDMQRYGFVNEVVPKHQLTETTQKLAELIAEKSPLALKRMKEVANAANDASRSTALAHEQVMLRKHQRSYDVVEGLNAFTEKRKPKFLGR
jgi:enoyl-CoA hydratase